VSGMRVILRADIAEVGKRGDICDVSNGYARNFLLPRGLAIKATDGAVTQAGSMRRARDLRDAEDRSAAEEVARALVARTITITAKAGPEGKLYGSVTAADVTAAVAAQAGVELDRKKLHLPEAIKLLGSHQVPVKLHSDVEFPITVEIVSA
jgi:large subunit ribosomal protein L9